MHWMSTVYAAHCRKEVIDLAVLTKLHLADYVAPAQPALTYPVAVHLCRCSLLTRPSCALAAHTYGLNDTIEVDPGDCKDAEPRCAQWASAGECTKNKGYMVG